MARRRFQVSRVRPGMFTLATQMQDTTWGPIVTWYSRTRTVGAAEWFMALPVRQHSSRYSLHALWPSRATEKIILMQVGFVWWIQYQNHLIPKNDHKRTTMIWCTGEHSVMERLVAYCSEEAHSSVEKAARLAAVRLRRLPVGNAASSADALRSRSPFWRSMAAETLERVVEQDLREGLVPFYCASAFYCFLRWVRFG